MPLSKLWSRKVDERPVQAVWRGRVLARSDDTVVLDRRHYFPPDSVDWSLLSDSDKETQCLWKGAARWFTVEVDGRVKRSAAWCYPRPMPVASEIEGRIAFGRGVKVGPEPRRGDAADRGSGTLRSADR